MTKQGFQRMMMTVTTIKRRLTALLRRADMGSDQYSDIQESLRAADGLLDAPRRAMRRWRE